MLPTRLMHRIVASTNEILEARSKRKTCLEELKVLFAIQFYKATVAPSLSRSSLFLPESSISPLFRRIDLKRYMSHTRFETLLSCLRLTSKPRPPYRDRLHEVREMINDFNEHTRGCFSPGTVTCLDESMVALHNPKAPAFVYVARKPHPVGNEYHTIADSQSRVIFKIELVEGKDQPPERPLAYQGHGKIGSLLLRMTEELRGKHHVVILDSAFTVLEALAELAKQGVHAAAVVKKRRFWPRHYPGDSTCLFMADKPIGELHTRRGIVAGVPMNIFAVRFPNFTFQMVATYGCSVTVGETLRIFTSAGPLSIRRNQVLKHYYEARHSVDDNNRFRQGLGVGLEASWQSQSWPVRQLTFILALIEVNAFLSYTFFCRPLDKITFQQFRGDLVNGLLEEFDAFLSDGEEQRELRTAAAGQRHELKVAPVFSGSYVNGAFKKVKQKYQKYKCRGSNCGKVVRTYCACSPGVWLCGGCMIDHVQSELIDITH